jgi:hypothetical protein
VDGRVTGEKGVVADVVVVVALERKEGLKASVEPRRARRIIQCERRCGILKVCTRRWKEVEHAERLWLLLVVAIGSLLWCCVQLVVSAVFTSSYDFLETFVVDF